MDYEEDEGFIGYIPTANDPGWSLLIGTILFCILSNMVLPCLVTMGRRYERKRLALQQSSRANEESTKSETTSRGAGGQEVGVEKNATRAQSMDDEDASCVMPSSDVHGKTTTGTTGGVLNFQKVVDKVSREKGLRV
jgi:hypothetical protein